MNAEILIVEDEGLIAMDLKRKLERAGYTVPAIVDNAEDALRSARDIRPALVLMDIRLNGPVDGIEAADQIRKQFHLPVMFVTAHADRATLDRARIAEPFGYIVKPFHSVDFCAQIEMALWKHQMEQKLRVSEAWLAATFRNVGDALIATDSEGNVALMNLPAARLTGWGQTEAVGKPLWHVFRAVDEITGLSAVLPVEEVSEGEGIGQQPCILTNRIGGTVIVEAEISANIDAGQTFGVIVAFRDITERRKAENQARQLQKMDALTLMATGLGRELAESQQKMDNSLRVLIEESERPAPRLLWDVYERSAHQQSVVQQLLTLGNSNGGEPSLLNLNDVLSGLEPKMHKVLGIHRSLRLRLQPGVPMILANLAYLRENLLRLVSDARQATAEGATVEVSTATVKSGPGKYNSQVVVRDNRKVLASSAKERTFDPYYQSRPGKRNPGFSLALVYQFAALSGGSIDVEVSPGEGSAYFLTFPGADPYPTPREPDGLKTEIAKTDRKTDQPSSAHIPALDARVAAIA
jgi:two-component system, cell cycle sensor histidine kinase and response regulator CckA